MAGNINKKTIISISVLLVIALGLFLLSVKYPNIFKKPGSNAPISAFPGDYSNQISGTITEVSGNVVTIEGRVRSSKSGSDNELTKTAVFTISPETKLAKSTMILKASKTPYTPERVDGAGLISDLTAGVIVVRLESREDLFTTDRAIATNVHYSIFSQPNAQ